MKHRVEQNGVFPVQSCHYFEAGDLALDSGEVLHGARLAYATQGELNAAADNAALVTTFFGGTHENAQYLAGPGMALDPERYFIVTVNLFGNGASTSPSHGLGPDFPLVSMADNVRVHHRFLGEAFGIKRLALATGHSMGAVSTYHLSTLFPEFVARAAPICGAARISPHNDVFLQGMRGILTADPAWNNGHYTTPPLKGLVTMARAWAAWPPSAHFYRHGHYEQLGYTSVEDYLSRYWEAFYSQMDANNVLAQIATWRSANIAANERDKGNFSAALAAIKANVVVMPCMSDAYFPPEDSEVEVAGMRSARLATIQSEWGHWAGSGRNPPDTAFIDQQIRALLESQ